MFENLLRRRKVLVEDFSFTFENAISQIFVALLLIVHTRWNAFCLPFHTRYLFRDAFRIFFFW